MSDLFKVDFRDVVHGIFSAVFGAVTSTLLLLINNSISNGTPFAFTKQEGLLILAGAVVAGLSYIQKRFFSNDEGKLGGKF